MTSATQSNSGASAYLAMLAGGLGKSDLLEAADLESDRVRAVARGLLRGVERSAGSSGWLADLHREGDEKGVRYDGMWNYEAVIKETNDKLRTAGREQLYAILSTRRSFCCRLAAGKARNALLQSRLLERIEQVLPMPEASAMLALLNRLAA